MTRYSLDSVKDWFKAKYETADEGKLNSSVFLADLMSSVVFKERLTSSAYIFNSTKIEIKEGKDDLVSVNLDEKAIELLEIVTCTYTTLWKEVSEELNSRYKIGSVINLSRFSPKIINLCELLANTYSGFDFINIREIKIGSNVYRYNKSDIVITPEIIEQLNKFSDQKEGEEEFFDVIDGQVVIL